MIVHLSEQIKRTGALIREHIDNHPDLKRQRELLDSILGTRTHTALKDRHRMTTQGALLPGHHGAAL